MIEGFRIRLLETSQDSSPFDLQHAMEVWNSPNYNRWFHANPIIIEADPFLLGWNGRLFLFYESKRLFSPGVIMMRYTDDLCHWSEETMVLNEKFHLSFPNVFVNNGTVYMIPETNEAGSIRLYRADNDDLTSFSLCNVLVDESPFSIKGTNFVDTALVNLKGIYYLLTTVMHESKQTLLLYYSNDLTGKYKYSAISPLLIDNQYGRNAGNIIESNGVYYRVSQDCSNSYGENVSIHQIEALTAQSYKESLYKDKLFDRSKKAYLHGGHQFCMVSYQGRSIVATDSKEYHLFLIPRVLRKIRRFFH